MKLTELKNEMIKAFKQHGDYDVKIVTNDDILEIKECGLNPSRYIFEIYADVSKLQCEGYHIEDDDLMEHCSNCDIYHQRDIKCPGCVLIKLKKNLGVLSSGKLF